MKRSKDIGHMARNGGIPTPSPCVRSGELTGSATR
ncbi:hypothetical protein FBZ88_104171 [Nitrospirillum bahiense]|uniref:Uncharacterized protein n=1 Tax=Nitrospirillum amazonense TaxID=28077 RepID=A0A560G545_9PROT|nr:hypothetical protein FBZ88_104171 [Nitrospirillum amazonense]